MLKIFCNILEEFCFHLISHTVLIALSFSPDGAVMPSWFDIHEIPVTAVSCTRSILEFFVSEYVSQSNEM